jgi:hypothetical protein
LSHVCTSGAVVANQSVCGVNIKCRSPDDVCDFRFFVVGFDFTLWHTGEFNDKTAEFTNKAYKVADGKPKE